MSDEAPHQAAAAGDPRPRAFLPQLRRHWFILCRSEELREKPLSRRLFGQPMVLFRAGDGLAAALADRCPHRNVPLSLGRVADGRLACAYHGWQFEKDGRCAEIPCLSGELGGRGKSAQAFPTRERDGFVWVYADPSHEPDHEPHVFALAADPHYTTVSRTVRAKASLYSTLENALDVPHTAFLHRGLFRSESRGIPIVARVRRSADRVEAEYVGEPRPPGVIGRLLSPSGGLVTHFDRFLLPSIAQVEYRIGDENHFLVDSVMTPVDDFVTEIHAVVSFRVRVPGRLIKPILEPLALRVFAQDAEILERQSQTIEAFGGEQFMSTEIDVLGPHIRRLMRASERGESAPPHEGEVTLLV